MELAMVEEVHVHRCYVVLLFCLGRPVPAGVPGWRPSLGKEVLTAESRRSVEVSSFP